MKPTQAYITVTLEVDPSHIQAQDKWRNPERELELYIGRLINERAEMVNATIRAVSWNGVYPGVCDSATEDAGDRASSHHPRLRCVSAPEVLRDLPESPYAASSEHIDGELRQSPALPGEENS